jgi:chaperonin GroES
MRVQPLHDRVLIERIEAISKTAGGVILPDNAKEKPAEGVVIAVGPGITNDAGVKRTLDVKEGDRVLFARHAGNELKVEGKTYLMMRESEVHAILKQE